VTLNPSGSSWSALIDGVDAGIRQCDFVGNPGIEHIRIRRSGVAIVGNLFGGTPVNHVIKVDGRTRRSPRDT
jgi:hypothetical protein